MFIVVRAVLGKGYVVADPEIAIHHTNNMGTKTELLEKIRKAKEEGKPLGILVITKNQYNSLMEGGNIDTHVTQNGKFKYFRGISVSVIGIDTTDRQIMITSTPYGSSPINFLGLDIATSNDVESDSNSFSYRPNNGESIRQVYVDEADFIPELSMDSVPTIVNDNISWATTGSSS